MTITKSHNGYAYELSDGSTGGADSCIKASAAALRSASLATSDERVERYLNMSDS